MLALPEQYASNEFDAQYPGLWRGLRGAWPFGIMRPYESRDLSGWHYHGTNNGPTWTPTEYGIVPSFDGSNDYIEIGTIPQVNFPFSIFARFRAGSGFTSDYRAVFCKRSDFDSNFVMDLEFIVSSGNITISVPAGAVNSTPTFSPTVGLWYSVCVNYPTSAGGTLSVNGSYYGTFPSITLGTGTADVVQIGANDSGGVSDRFLGVISELEYRSRAMSPREIALRHAIPYAPFLKKRRVYGLTAPAAGAFPPNSLALTGVGR